MLTSNNILKIKTISLKIPAGSQSSEFYFTDQPDLRTGVMQNLVLYPPDVSVRTPSNQQVMSDNLFRSSFITLFDMKGYKFVDSVPLEQFNPFMAKTPGNLWVETFRNQQVNWTKCYVHIANIAWIDPLVDEYLQLSIIYELIEVIKQNQKK